LLSAAAHRHRLAGVTFIGVTGSCGKTTTVSLIHGVLGGQLRGRKSAGSNGLKVIAGAVLRTTKADAFSVIEVAAWEPGSVARAARVVQPDVAVVTNIGSDHRGTFRTLEATAAEKSDLAAHLRRDGTLVLNADDPRVMAMAPKFSGTTVTFGLAPEAMLRAQDVRSEWPQRMSFTLCYGGSSLPVVTKLCGRHWVSSALATLAVAVALELSLEEAVSSLAQVDPYPGRMSPVERDGAVFIRDDHKAPLWTVDAVLDFLSEAHACRKIAVFGTLSDYSGSSSGKYRAVARRALAVCDEVLFVGANAVRVKKLSAAATGRLHAFPSVDDAARHVRSDLRPGDLVLLKGSSVDRLDRI
jgi:UDP-N-acetylmuramyl pentapeptide synthase